MIKVRLISRSVLVGALSIAFVTGALAQEPQTSTPQHEGGDRGERMRHGREGGGRGMMRVFERLNLTDEQKLRVNEIRSRFEENTRTLREDLRNLREQSRQGTPSAEDQARAEQLRQQLNTANKQMYEEVKAVLTPEQKAQLEQMKQEKKGKRRGSGSESQANPEGD
jgi:Spy/CpxP family protein refolding chaperone